MAPVARLRYRDQDVELPLVEGRDGSRAVDVSSLRAETGLIVFDPSLSNTGACRSAITQIDGERGTLCHRGIPIEQLVDRSTFVETAYLLVYGQLPKVDELARFQARLASSAPLHESFKHHFEGFPVNAPPMAMLSAMVSTLACFHPSVQEADAESFDEQAAWLLSKTPTIAAYSYRRSRGMPFVYPHPQLGYPGNFLHLMFSEPLLEHQAEPELARALDQLLILHADHELGCSTATVRIVGSSRANLFASCAAGICSLWGPVHGGATIAVVEMLESIHRGTATIPQLLARARDRQTGFRLKGFGHRVYKTDDPRAVLLKKIALRLRDRLGLQDPLFDIALRLEEEARRDPYFIDHQLFPNADFYSGIVMRALGIPQSMFTVVFAIGRMPGWIAHWKEQFDDPEARIARPRQIYVGPRLQSYTPLERR
jgi:citrate synthase